MGKIASVALPVAAAIAAPYAAGAIGAASAASAASAANAIGMAKAALSSSFYVPVLASSPAAVSPWLVAASAGLTGLNQLNALQQQRYQAARSRAAASAEQARQVREFERAEKQRRTELRRNLASQRARFAAGGISSNSGSAGALLRGLEKNKDGASADHHKSMKAEIAASNRVNLLEESASRKQLQYDAFRKSISPFINLLEP